MSDLDATALVQDLRTRFDSGHTRGLAWRQRQLTAMRQLILDNESAILEALRQDLGKPAFEGDLAEVSFVLAELGLAQRKLPRWMRAQKARPPLAILPASAWIEREPLGVVLIIGPWNYPFHLVMLPLLSALAAGNCAVVKPSEVSAATSALLARLIPQYLDPRCVQVVEGGVAETTQLLAQRFDHIFYTGNGTVGRIVMAAAARHLTPVTLELGGKNPCYVDPDIDLDVTARRIAWGKFFNAGQTCVAPDYLLVHEAVHDALIEALGRALRAFYGPDPQHSPDYARIVNPRHHARLVRLLASGRVAHGGQHDVADRFLAPTVLVDVEPESPVMGDEIFGPILPALRIRDRDAALAFARQRPRPLASYVFSNDAEVQRHWTRGITAGAVVVNHCWVHMGAPSLPFGGVGASGMGVYHGRHGFETFSHRKPVVNRPQMLDLPLLYPPYSERIRHLVRRVL
ncbi:MAG: aldehyde dehydrogenase family protein [Pseudomonadota bacterium]